jgi:hypothetical protein
MRGRTASPEELATTRTCVALTGPAKRFTLQTVGAHLREDSPSAARSLSALEATDLAAVALSLPDSWCVALEPPYGQMAIGPLAGRRRFHRCHIAASKWGAVRRDTAASCGVRAD